MVECGDGGGEVPLGRVQLLDVSSDVPDHGLGLARLQGCQMAKFDPTPSTLAQSKERKGSNFAIWQP